MKSWLHEDEYRITGAKFLGPSLSSKTSSYMSQFSRNLVKIGNLSKRWAFDFQKSLPKKSHGDGELP
jgi:hypothetical protein